MTKFRFDVTRKALICLLILSILSVSAIFQPGRTVFADSGFDGGTGTPEDPYLISTPAQLDSVRDNLTKSFKLTADIDLGDYAGGDGWEPIGKLVAGGMFTGSMDGDGHAITNLTINRPAEDYVGLFGMVSGGSIRNLRMIGATVVARNYAGTLAGRVWGIYGGQQSAVSNSSSSGGSLTGSGWLGGLVGDSLRIAIDNSYSSTVVTGTNSVAGGLVGVIGQGTISNSYATGNVKADTAAGGLVGSNSSVINSSLPSVIRSSYATGNVEGNKSVGGLVGINANSDSSYSLSVISDSYATGRATGAERIGGLVGYNYTASIINSYAIGVVEGTTEIGGLTGASVTDQILSSFYDKETTGIYDVHPYARSTEQMKTPGTYIDWSFDDTWSIDSSIHGGYPYLPAPVLPAAAAPGQEAGTTKVSAAASAGNRLVAQVASSDRAVPGLGDAMPASGVTDPYVPGSDIAGVDAAVNKYVSIYEVNPDGNVVKFKQIELMSGDILTYTINALSDQNLDALTVGYASGSQTSRVVTITRSGTGVLTQLAVHVSGDAFAYTQPVVSTLDDATPSTSFTVQPKDGLAVGTYTATVTVAADHMTDRTFTVTQIVNAPGAPTLQLFNAGNAQATLEWSAVSHATSYRIYKRADSGVYDREEATVTGATYRHTVAGLVNGTSYYFIVRAVIDEAEGADSNEVVATPMTVPGAPTNVTAAAGDGQASIAFSAPADNGGSAVTRYTVTSSPGGSSASGTTSPIVVTGLSNGTTYTFTVVAANSQGDGPASTASNAAMHPIGVPVLQSPVAGDKQVMLQWSPVGEASGYRIYKRTASGSTGTVVDTVSAATLGYTVKGLTNSANYYFTIRAMVGAVESADSNEVAAMPVRWAGPGAPAGTFAGGTGIEENPYLIANASQLNAVRNYLNGSYRLIANIDLSSYADGEGWVPIGSSDPALSFSGSMDGGAFRITGLTIDRPTEDYIGLFGYVTGQLANLTVDAATVAGHDFVGGAAGFVKYGTIRNSRISGTVTGNNDVGGVAGKVFPGTIDNSYNAASITGFYRVGGLVGSGSDAATIGNSRSSGNVTGIADSFYIGGLVGQIDGDRAKVANSYATGEVSGASDVGGLAGSSLAAHIVSSYSTGDVTADWTAGGLVGRNNFGTVADSYTRSSVTVRAGGIGGFTGYNAGTTVTRNYAAGSVTGGAPGGFAGMYVGAMPDSNFYDRESILADDVFALPLSANLMKTSGTYADWDFDRVWGIDATVNAGYPYLRYLAPELPAAAGPGDRGGTTKVIAEPSFGNHLVIQVLSAPVSTPAIRTAVPASSQPGVLNPYPSGTDISGVDASTNKYVAIYEADNEDKVVKFAQIILTIGDIQPINSTGNTGGQTPVTLNDAFADPGDEHTGAILQVKAEVRRSGNGMTISDVTVDTEQLARLIGSLKGKDKAARTVTIAVEGGADQVKVNLPSAAILKTTDSDITGSIVIDTGSVTYNIPLGALTGLAKRAPAGNISIAINKVDKEMYGRIRQAAEAQGLLLMNDPIEFRITVGEQEVTEFGRAYVERTAGVQSGIEPSRATAARYDPAAGTFRFVPTIFEVVNGATRAVMKSPHNSIYVVVRSDKTFLDTNGHWAKTDIEMLASKLIVSGISATVFEPEGSITRAQFVALLVRSLGLVADAGAPSFHDIHPNDWFSGEVEAAVQAGLINGFEDGTFRPEDRITREQMAVIIAGALQFTGNASDIHPVQNEQLVRFTDADRIHSWAKEAVALSVEAGIISGRPDARFAPVEAATRAEAVSMLGRMLRYIGFIN